MNKPDPIDEQRFRKRIAVPSPLTQQRRLGNAEQNRPDPVTTGCAIPSPPQWSEHVPTDHDPIVNQGYSDLYEFLGPPALFWNEPELPELQELPPPALFRKDPDEFLEPP